MAFNYAYEKKKFEKEWKQLQKEYAAAGMSFEDIEAMRQFDLDIFNSNRRFFSHTQPLLSSDCGEDDYGQEDKSVLLVRFSEAMSVTDDGVSFHSRYWWIEELDAGCTTLIPKNAVRDGYRKQISMKPLSQWSTNFETAMRKSCHLLLHRQNACR